MKTAVRIALMMLSIATILLAGCKSKPRDPFPASGQISGWQKTDDTRTFAAKDLWQYIDGDSEQYLQAGVVTTSTSDYKFQNKVEAVVDVHTMRDGGGAQRIFDSGKGADARVEQIGDSAYAYGQSVVFRKGPYLVRIVAWQSTPETPQALVALARGVESKL